MEIKQTPEQTPKDHIEALVSAVYSGYTGLADFDVAKTVVSELLSLRECETVLRLEIERLKAENSRLNIDNRGLRERGDRYLGEVHAAQDKNTELNVRLEDQIEENKKLKKTVALWIPVMDYAGDQPETIDGSFAPDVCISIMKNRYHLQSLNTELVETLRLLHSMCFDQPYYTKEQSDTFRRVTAVLSRAEGKTT